MLMLPLSTYTMKRTIDFSFNRGLTKEYSILLLLFIIALVLVVIIALFSQSLRETYDTYSLLRNEVETIETRITIVDSYKLLSPEEIRNNNQFLETLIPSSDTNLSMYYILDDLSIKQI